MARLLAVAALIASAVTGSTWAGTSPVCEPPLLLDADGESGDLFGQSVSISGNLAIVGAHLDDVIGTDSGSASIFQRFGAFWLQVAKLVPNDAAAGDRFGTSVSISGDTAVVGAIWDDDAGSASGSATVFQRIESAWLPQAKLVSPIAESGDLFGWSVAIDGDTIVVGAPGADPSGVNSGAAYVFHRVNGIWGPAIELHVSDGDPGDQFGAAVAISGLTAVVGAPLDDDDGSAAGSTYVFQRFNNSWSIQTKLSPQDPSATALFGWSVDVSEDIAVIGAYGSDLLGTDSGCAYIFSRIGAGWTEEAQLSGDSTSANDRFGSSVAVDGFRVLVGAPFDSGEVIGEGPAGGGNGPLSGTAWLFERGKGWHLTEKFTAPNAAAGDQFGWSVDVQDEEMLVGAILADILDFNSGAVHVFSLSDADCNENGVLDSCDIFNGTSADINFNGVPDECEKLGDSDGDGVPDLIDECPDTPPGEPVNADGCPCPGDGCDDGDVCTIDFCDGETCFNLPVVCFDGDPCTLDLCVKGTCIHVPTVCDDGDDCTVDTCEPVPGEGPCCTTGESPGCADEGCEFIICAYVPTCCEIAWDEVCAGVAGEICDSCQGAIAQCSHEPIECFDGDPCTADLCINGECDFSQSSCDDGDPCTVDSCDGRGGCTNEVIECDDEDPCTIDTCVGEACVYIPLDCDDNDPCTLDECSFKFGCINIPIQCDDKDPCTTDSCGSGGCEFTPIECDDGDPCTIDSCSGGECTSGEPSPDSDGDGVCDALDGCPDDINKTEPGACGCGVPDSDDDENGVPDCLEEPCVIEKLTAPTGQANDNFGYSVAISGSIAVVGAIQAEGAEGAAYVFVRESGQWVFEKMLQAQSPQPFDNFGWAVDVDGDTIVVGAPFDDETAGLNVGSVHVFVRGDGSWPLQQKIVPTDGQGDDRFGEFVSLSSDTFAATSSRDDDQGSNAGKTYVYVRSGVTWSLQQKLYASDPGLDDQFGTGVSLHGDTLAVSAMFDNAPAADSGSVYVFVRSAGVWAQQQKIVAGDGAVNDRFGASISLHGDRVLVGVPFRAPGGVVYVFDRSVDTWNFVQKLLADDSEANDEFGFSVATLGDQAIVGARRTNDYGNDSGAAYLFDRIEGVWTQRTKLLEAGDPGAGDQLGNAVDLTAETAIVGSWQDDSPAVSQGSASLFGTAYADCNGNGVADACDISSGNSSDENNNGVPDECDKPPTCPADLTADGFIDGADLGLLLGAWDTADAAADLDESGLVDGADLGLLLASWGECEPPASQPSE